jgi:hypothetical protein
MNEKNKKHSSVGRSFEIDRSAVNILLNFLPHAWLPRKQDPDVFVDYLVEIVENGEPTGLHFGVQVKGYEDTSDRKKPLVYSFKTKHLDYYLHRSQHPVFLFLINVTTGEGFWLFAQKHLKDNVSQTILDKQKSFSIPFSPDDSLLNITKFKCLLPEAEKFVRDLHPGSVQAALQKRKADLEAKDPRCSVSISVKDGTEHLVINAKEDVPFKMKVESKNVEGLRNFFERGDELGLEQGEIEISGAPILEEAFKNMGGFSKIQFGTQQPANVQIVCGAGENLIVIQIDGYARAGTKYVTFRGELPASPLQATLEISRADPLAESSVGFRFPFIKWNSQPLLMLPYFADIETLARSLAMSNISNLHWYIRGNLIMKSILQGYQIGEIKEILAFLERLRKCRWIAQHCKVNPILPNLKTVSREEWDTFDEVYGLLNDKEIASHQIRGTLSCVTANPPPVDNYPDRGDLKLEKEAQMIDFFGESIRLGPTRHIFSALRLVSCSSPEIGKTKLVFGTTDTSTQTSSLIGE